MIYCFSLRRFARPVELPAFRRDCFSLRRFAPPVEVSTFEN
jgi:hypothetical protein